MQTNDLLINRVAESGLVTFDPAMLLEPTGILSFDLKDNLFQELILKEKDFRSFLKAHNWKQYTGAMVAVHCSADAIIPTWAYMLVGSYLQAFAKIIAYGSPDAVLQLAYHDKLHALNLDKFKDKRVVVKGCGSIPVPNSVYLEIAVLFRPIVKSLMFGEPCSTVPIFKNA